MLDRINPLSPSAGRKILLLHVGLIKTGTSALQYWGDNNRETLLEHGVLYPSPSVNETAPKHQFLVNGLLKRDFSLFRASMKEREHSVLLLSSEGLSNHFDRFSESALEEFRQIVVDYEVHIFMVTRDARTWVKSCWKEGLVGSPGFSGSVDSYANTPAIKRMRDHEKMAADISAGFGAAHTTLVRTEDGWRESLLSLLEIYNSEEFEEPAASNVSVPDDLCEILRQVNSQRLRPNLRRFVLGLIQDCFNTSSIRLIEAQAAPGIPGLRQIDRIREILASLTPQNENQFAIRAELMQGCDGLRARRAAQSGKPLRVG